MGAIVAFAVSFFVTSTATLVMYDLTENAYIAAGVSILLGLVSGTASGAYVRKQEGR